MVDSLFAQLLTDVGRSIGIPQLTGGDAHVCQLVFDGRHQVQIIDVPTRDQILVSCPVGDTKLSPEQALDVTLSNFMQAANGIVACTSPRDGRLLLQLGHPRNSVSAAELLMSIEALLQQVEAWEVKQSRAPLPPVRPGMSNKYLLRSV